MILIYYEMMVEQWTKNNVFANRTKGFSDSGIAVGSLIPNREVNKTQRKNENGKQNNKNKTKKYRKQTVEQVLE